jgi:hypothetical protein
MALPFFYVLYGMFGHEITPTVCIVSFFAFPCLCLSCWSLVDHQPELARRGMICLGIFLILLLISGVLYSPISG